MLLTLPLVQCRCQCNGKKWLQMLALSSLGTFVDATNTVDLLDFLMADVRTKLFLKLEGVVGGACILYPWGDRKITKKDERH